MHLAVLPHVCVYMCLHVFTYCYLHYDFVGVYVYHLHTSASRDRLSDPLEPELQINHLTWVLGTESGPMEEPQALTTEARPQP